MDRSLCDLLSGLSRLFQYNGVVIVISVSKVRDIVDGIGIRPESLEVLIGQSRHFVEVVAESQILESVTVHAGESIAARLPEACDIAHRESDGRHETEADSNAKQSERNGIQRLE